LLRKQRKTLGVHFFAAPCSQSVRESVSSFLTTHQHKIPFCDITLLTVTDYENKQHAISSNNNTYGKNYTNL